MQEEEDKAARAQGSQQEQEKTLEDVAQQPGNTPQSQPTQNESNYTSNKALNTFKSPNGKQE